MYRVGGLFLIFTCMAMLSLAVAQPPGLPDSNPNRGGSKSDPSAFVKRMMTFDANQDGRLSKDEITDERLVSLFERADADHDGIVTKEELTAIYTKESTGSRRGTFGDAFDRQGPGGEGTPPGGPPRIGEVLPPHMKEALKLSTAQKKKIEALQKLVEEKLGQILTDEQNQLLAEMRYRGPGGERGPGGGRGPGGPGGDRGRFGPPSGELNGERPDAPPDQGERRPQPPE